METITPIAYEFINYSPESFRNCQCKKHAYSDPLLDTFQMGTHTNGVSAVQGTLYTCQGCNQYFPDLYCSSWYNFTNDATLNGSIQVCVNCLSATLDALGFSLCFDCCSEGKLVWVRNELFKSGNSMMDTQEDEDDDDPSDSEEEEEEYDEDDDDYDTDLFYD